MLRRRRRTIQALGIDIELLRCLGKGYLDTPLRRIGLGSLHIGRSQVLEHLQTVIRVAALHSQGDGDIESDHTGAGNTDTHGVLKDIGAYLHIDLRRLLRPEKRARLGHCQSYCDRLGTAEGRLYLTVQKFQNIGICLRFHDYLFSAKYFSASIAARHPEAAALMA